MIDTSNMRTASLYINNQLLSRGLLRDGHNIDFTLPGTDEEAADTMGRIMSIVNDLILRRDKDAEHRESLSTSMRAIRAENMQNTKQITALTDKHTEAKRKLDLAESSEAALRTQLKSAEAAARGLKEEMIRTKALVAQARASCATDVRRRDRQIDSLKKQLGEAGRARGARTNPAITTIHVTGEVRGEKGTPVKKGSMLKDGYSLRDETNGFLAKLAQNLSEENESMLGAMRRTITQLQEMSGFAANSADGHVVKQHGWDHMAGELDAVLDHMKTILSNPSFVPIEEVVVREEEIARLKDGWVKMESRWKDAMVLIDGWRKRMVASGKPVNEEELMLSLHLSPAKERDEYKDQRYADLELSAVAEEEEEEEEDEEDAAMDLREESPCPSEAGSLHLVPAAEEPLEAETVAEAAVEEESEQQDESWLGAASLPAPQQEHIAEEPSFEILQTSTAAASQQPSQPSSPLPEPPQLSPLRPTATSGNRGATRSSRLRHQSDETTDATKKAKHGRTVAADAPQPPVKRLRPQPQPTPRAASRVTKPSQTKPSSRPQRRVTSGSALDEAQLRRSISAPEAETKDETKDAQSASITEETAVTAQQTPLRGPSTRLPAPDEEEPEQSPLTMATIAAKLAASEKEADAARVRAKLRSLRAARTMQKPTLSAPISEAQPEPQKENAERVSSRKRTELSQEVGDENVDMQLQQQEQVKPEKRKRDARVSRAAGRRRSTLSPLELQSLISGNVQ